MRMISRNILCGYGPLENGTFAPCIPPGTDTIPFSRTPTSSGTLPFSPSETSSETHALPISGISDGSGLSGTPDHLVDGDATSGAPSGSSALPTIRVQRFPHQMSEEEFLPSAYLFMRLARRMEERLFDLYRQGLVKGTVTQGIGNEAAAIGAAFPLRPGTDVVSLLHRDLGSHLLLGATPYQIFCQYLGNAESPTAAREGNVHYGDANRRRFPMISHLGAMLSTVVGATWSARRNGENVFGMAVIGDGGTSTGAFHEAVNLASVFHVPMIFLIENNSYAFSTPVEHQYRCAHLADRATGYGITGETVDGTDVWAVYEAMTRHLREMCEDETNGTNETVGEIDEIEEYRRKYGTNGTTGVSGRGKTSGKGGPVLLEVTTCRLVGHAVYDSAKYVYPERMAAWRARDPLTRGRRALAERGGL
ncbi:MAG: thiamine pyrophosphate-dependent dehydrogenase E1 component subunit alpha, partial [Planctomycetia bacterium]|nr:thiamine pyrophosphate-dependent dehydrogenase E1 component subunit alpha [Planctomycetia bacterium]